MLTADNSAACERCGRLVLMEGDEFDEWIMLPEDHPFGVVILVPICADCATEEEKEEEREERD